MSTNQQELALVLAPPVAPPELASLPVLEPLELPASLARDDFVFEEGRHVYHLAGRRLKGVSSVVKQFSRPFDEDYWSKKKAEQRGITQQEMLDEWAAERDRSTRTGSAVHDGAEWILTHGTLPPESVLLKHTDIEAELADARRRLSSFVDIRVTKLQHLVPKGLELRVFSERLGIAGTMDLLGEQGGYLYVGDWKTNKAFKDYSFMLEPFQYYADGHLARYSLQVSLYRIMLAEHGVQTKGGFVVHFRPDGETVLERAFDLRRLAWSALAR